ncbi:MAG: hypothetical protein HEP71_10590 [Roseivirga sp.]|nr:hypothetical protein [Roseivirga sp.]
MIKKILILFICLSCQLAKGQERPIYFSGGFGFSDLFRVNADGSGTQRLTVKESRGEYQPQVSPDGKYVVFNTYRYGGWKLAIAELENGKIKKGWVRKLVGSSKGYEYDANWSADGKSVAFVGFPSGRSGRRQLFLVNPADGKAEQLTNTAYGHYAPSFSPDGKSLYYQAAVGEVYGILRMDIASRKTEVISSSEDAHEVAPALSPDGSQLAFYRVHADESVTVHVLDLKAKTDKLIYGKKEGEKSFLNTAWDTPLFSYSIGWSSGGDRFVFTKHHGESIFELYIATPKTGKVKQITSLKEASTQPSWY